MLLVSAILVQDAADSYAVRLTVRAENQHNIANILKRHLADLEGVRKMSWDSNRRTLTLTVSLGSVLTRKQIEDAMPRVYDVEKVEVQNLPGTVVRQKDKILLRVPRTRHPFVLEETGHTQSWFRKLDKNLEKSKAWAVWGTVTEARVGRGLFARTVMTVSVWRIQSCTLPDLGEDEPLTLRLFLDSLRDEESSGLAAERALLRTRGVDGASWDAEAGIMTVTWEADRKLDLAALKNTLEDHATISRVAVDGLRGRVREGRDELILKTADKVDYHLVADTPMAKLGVGIARKMLEGGTDRFRVSGEIVRDGKSLKVRLRSIRPAE